MDRLRLHLSVFVAAAITTFACSWDYPIWIPRSKSADPLYRFVRNGKAGYIDVGGRIVIPPKLPVWGNYGSEFHDGLLEVSVSGGGYVDKTGKLVLDPGLYRGWDFSEGLAVAMRKGENLWGYIDTSGKFVIPPRFSTSPNGYVYSFSEGLAMIDVKGQMGFVDRSGAFVIPPGPLLDATAFSDGMSRVVVEGPCIYFPEGGCGAFNPRRLGARASAGALPSCKFTYIDRTGRIVTNERFTAARDFSEGLAPVRSASGSLWGFIDKNGAWAIPPKFEDAQPFSSGLTLIKENEKYGYADKSGRVVIEPRFAFAENFSEGRAVVGDRDGPYRYIDTKGQQSFPGTFELASPFFKGLAHVKLVSSRKTATYAYIDAKGSVVFRY